MRRNAVPAISHALPRSVAAFAAAVCVLTATLAAAEPAAMTGVVRVVEIDYGDERPPERRVTVRDRDGVFGAPGRELRLQARPAVPDGSAAAELPPPGAVVPLSRPVSDPLISGQIVRVEGEALGETLVVESGASMSIDIVSEPASETLAVTNSAVVILGNFQDKNLTCTFGDVEGTVFTNSDSLAAMLGEAAYGAVSFSGATLGPYTIPFDSTSFSFESWDDALRDAAINAGEDLSGFAHHFYVLPSNALSSSGLGTVGVDPVDMITKAWIFNCSRPGTYAHEFGHNLTLSHASRYFADTGTVQTFGDQSDNMGSTIELRHYNAPHKMRLGWVAPSSVWDVQADGVYVLRRLFDTGPGWQVLRIKNVDPTIPPFLDTENYLVSYRVGQGFDLNLPATWQDRVFVHEASDANVTTYLREWLDTGETFSEPMGSLSNVTVEVLSMDGVNATVQIAGVPPPIPSLSPFGLVLLAASLAGLALWGATTQRTRRATRC